MMVAVLCLGMLAQSACLWKGESIGRKYARLSNQLAFTLADTGTILDDLANQPNANYKKLAQFLAIKDRVDRTNLKFIRAARQFVVCKGTVLPTGQCDGARVIEIKQDGMLRIRDIANELNKLGQEIVRENWSTGDVVADARISLVGNALAIAIVAFSEFIAELVKKMPNTEYLDPAYQEKAKAVMMSKADEDAVIEAVDRLAAEVGKPSLQIIPKFNEVLQFQVAVPEFGG